MTIRNAMILADMAHAGQTRIGGAPFLSHPLGVAQRVSDAGFDSEMIEAAWLHDVIEDGSITAENMRLLGVTEATIAELSAVDSDDAGRLPCTTHLLRAVGFSERVISLVDLLTRQPGGTYVDYIIRISHDIEAAWLKLFDIDHNTSPESTEHLDADDQRWRARRYDAARKRLLEAISSDVAHAHLAA